MKKLFLCVLLFVAVNAGGQNRRKIVAQDGSGDYRTVQAAFDDISKQNKTPVVIFVKKGVFKEKLLLDSGKNFVTLEGEDKFNTILTFDDHSGKKSPDGKIINTRTSWSVKVKANDFTARNITFQNDAGFTAGQAVAMESNGDRAIFDNCRFLGFQDVLFTNSDKSRQYFKNCYIEGTTDFIFGSATAWFEKCHIHSKKNSHVTAASTPPQKKFGYIFNECVLTGDTSLHNVSLGRPWQPFAAVAYIRCFMGEHIKAEGWNDWNKVENQGTARFSEYKSFGASFDPGKRVTWIKQLSEKEIKEYTIKNVFGDWNPLK